MRVMGVEKFGAVENLKPLRVPVRVPEPDEVLIRVAAAAVNPADLGMREGRYRWADPVRFPLVPGYDVAGTVVAGPEVWPEGLPVVAITAHKATQTGGYAEYVTLPTRYVAPLPSGLDPVDAATLPLAGLTAQQAIEALALPEGATVAVAGARGAVGGYAVQLAELAGLTEAAEGPADGALDTVGGATARALFARVRDGGRYATVVPQYWVPGGQFDAARGITPQVLSVRFDGAALGGLARLAGGGELRTTRVARRLPLEAAAQAHELVAAGGIGGKIVLVP